MIGYLVFSPLSLILLPNINVLLSVAHVSLLLRALSFISRRHPSCLWGSKFFGVVWGRGPKFYSKGQRGAKIFSKRGPIFCVPWVQFITTYKLQQIFIRGGFWPLGGKGDQFFCIGQEGEPKLFVTCKKGARKNCRSANTDRWRPSR